MAVKEIDRVAGPNRALVAIPGTLFWVLVIAGAATGNDALVGAAMALLVATFATVGFFAAKTARLRKAARAALLARGEAATARVVRIGTGGGSINDNPRVDLVLEVQRAEGAPYEVEVSALISKLAIPRIQPDCTIAVTVDPLDPTAVLVDEDLTPYGY